MKEPPRLHRWKRSGVAILILTIFLLSFVQREELWYWISTQAEPDWDWGGAPIDVTPPIPGEVRLLRWGPYTGQRHGPFRGVSEGQVLTGRYDRGRPSGIWRITEGGVVTGVGFARGPVMATEIPDQVTLLGIEVEISRDGWQWRQLPFLEWRRFTSELIAVGRNSDGGFSLGEAGIDWPPSSDGALFWPWQWLEFDADRNPTRYVSRDVTGFEALETSLDPTGAITAQVQIHDDGAPSTKITAPPWHDPFTGDLPGER